MDFRTTARDALWQLSSGDAADFDAALAEYIAPGARFYIATLDTSLEGRDAIAAGWFGALRTAFGPIRRRDLLFIGGENRRDTGGTWVASVTHYVGTFDAPFFGIAPSGKLVFLRSGEFYRIENGQITEAKIIWDGLDLMYQARRFPLPLDLGTEIAFPAPETQDGLCPASAGGDASLDVVEAMIRDLHAYNPETYESEGQVGENGVWHPQMLWYGPASVGSTYQWSGFVGDHRKAFLDAFPDRKGGNHFCRIGDGNYAAFSGWPSITMTHRGPYLGVPATNKALTLRVMDFYRISGGKIMENWVLLDYLKLFRDMGEDLVAKSNAQATPAPPA